MAEGLGRIGPGEGATFTSRFPNPVRRAHNPR